MNIEQKKERKLKFKSNSSIFLTSREYFVYLRIKMMCYYEYAERKTKSWTISKLRNKIYDQYKGDKKEVWIESSKVTQNKISACLKLICFSGRLRIKQIKDSRIVFLSKEWKEEFDYWKPLMENNPEILKERPCKECLLKNVIIAYKKQCLACRRSIIWKNNKNKK